MWNGNVKEPSENIDIYDNAVELLKPFRMSYNKGLLENFSIETEAEWATNIKRSIAGILQLDLSNLEKEVAFNSSEVRITYINMHMDAHYIMTVNIILNIYIYKSIILLYMYTKL